MVKNTLIAILLVVAQNSFLFAQSQNTFFPEEKFSSDSLKIWTSELFDELSESHPGFYRYTSKKKFDSIINTTISSIETPLTTIEYYRKLKPLFAQIGCLHTSLNLSEDYETYLNEKPNLIPVEVFISDKNQVFITKNHSDNNTLKVKSELISINGKPIEEILAILMQSIPSDGYNLTLKTQLLNYRFSFWYRSIIEFSETFSIKTKYNDTVQTTTLNGVKFNTFQPIETLQGVNTEQLDFRTEDETGILTIKSFAKTDIKSNNQNFKEFIKSTFKNLKQNRIKYLIVDLRNNSGGTDGNAAFFTSYFFDKPYRYWDKIEVTKAIAEQIKGKYSLFYKKPEKLDSTYLWKGALLTKEFDYYKLQKPNNNNFKGKVFIITNGLCMSSCSDVVAILSHNKKAKIIGQETGGGYQGNSSGMMPTTKIKGNLTFTIPLQKYTNAVDSNKNFGHGTLPDYPVNPTLDDWITKEDVEMKLTKKLINK